MEESRASHSMKRETEHDALNDLRGYGVGDSGGAGNESRQLFVSRKKKKSLERGGD